MKLIELKLRNFKGIKSLELKASGENLAIYGDNATGKTTVYDAFLWLLFDKDSQNKADFAIKTLDSNGNVINHLDHEVEGKFKVDGDEIVLRKVYREKYTKKRGSATESFSGHETDYFIDGVPVKKSEYTARVNEIAPEDQFRLLTSPVYFNEHMSWQDRRKTLLEVCGDISDADVIASKPELKKLPAILGKHSTDDYKKIITARRTEINKELDKIPVRIDEATNGLPDLSEIKEPKAIDAELKRLKEILVAKNAELAKLLSGGDAGDKKQRIAEIEAEMLTIETTYKREHASKVGEAEAKVRGSQNLIQDIQHQISTKESELENNREAIKTFEKTIVDLRTMWHETNDEELAGIYVEESCPTCGQDLPDDEVQDARNKAIARFKADKAQRLTDINTAGKAQGGKLEKAKSLIEELEKEIAGLRSNLAQQANDNTKLNEELAKVKETFDDYQEQADYKKLLAEKDKLQKVINGDRSAVEPEKERLKFEIVEIEGTIETLTTAKASLDMHAKTKERITRLKLEETTLATEFEQLEQELFLIEEFVRAKVDLLTDRINSKFKYARFKLFETQINGGITEVCETLYRGVPYSGGLNNAARINVGLDIINTLAEHYGFAPPVFIDNAEAVTELIPVEGQLISLVVSEKDKSLRIEGQAGKVKQQLSFEEAV